MVWHVLAGTVHFVPPVLNRNRLRSVFCHMIGSFLWWLPWCGMCSPWQGAFCPTKARSQPVAICILPYDWLFFVVAALVWHVLAGKVHFVPAELNRNRLRSVFCHMIGSFLWWLSWCGMCSLAGKVHFVPSDLNRNRLRSIFCYMICSFLWWLPWCGMCLLARCILSHQSQIATGRDLYFCHMIGSFLWLLPWCGMCSLARCMYCPTRAMPWLAPGCQKNRC